MSRPASNRARRLAGELELRFAQGGKLVREVNNAHHSVQRANDRLRWRLQPAGVTAVCGERPTAVDAALTHNRSDTSGATDSSREARQPPWTVHDALVGCQTADELRRQLAAEIGELPSESIATGRSEQDTRETDLYKLLNSREGLRSGKQAS